MRAWYVTMDVASPGMRLKEDDSGAWTIGPGVPVVGHEHVLEQLREYRSTLEQRAADSVGFIPSLDVRTTSGHIDPTRWISPQQATRMLRDVKMRGWPIGDVHLDRSDEGRLWVPVHPMRGRDTGECLLHVAPVAADPESVQFYCPDGVSKEVPDSKNGGVKVIREFDPGFGAGCTVLSATSTAFGPELLVKMSRGASFRITRGFDETNPEDPVETVVIWTGGAIKLQPSKRGLPRASAAA